MIDESVYDSIHSALPDESPLSGPLRTATSNGASSARATPATSQATSPAPPTEAFANLDVKTNSQAPPTYESTPPPSLPARNAKPIVAHARALYRYQGADARDVALEKDDKVAVHEYMNQDWWMGQNLRTGQEGIFPRNYVLVEHEEKAPVQPMYGYPAQTNGPPAQQNPYNSNVPPMAVAEGGQHEEGKEGGGSDKMQQYGKKFGKKLGNAAIFGAGATIGGNIVNSIF